MAESMSLSLPNVYSRIFPMLTGGVYRRQVVVLMGRLDLLMSVYGMVFPAAQISVPPPMIHTENARFDRLRKQRP